MDLKNFFCLGSNLRDDDIISAYRSGLKTGMDLVWSGLKTGFLSVETASTLLYAQETTTAHLRSHSCFPDCLVILNEDRILSND